MAVKEVDALYPIPSLSDLSLGYPAVFLLVGPALEDAGQPQAQMTVTLVSAVLCFSLQPADQMQKCILMPSHALHLGRWKEGKISLLRQNTLAHFASRSIEAPIYNGGGKAYC